MEKLNFKLGQKVRVNDNQELIKVNNETSVMMQLVCGTPYKEIKTGMVGTISDEGMMDMCEVEFDGAKVIVKGNILELVEEDKPVEQQESESMPHNEDEEYDMVVTAKVKDNKAFMTVIVGGYKHCKEIELTPEKQLQLGLIKTLVGLGALDE